MGIENIARAPLFFSNHGVGARMTAARDFCMKNAALEANASQFGWRLPQYTDVRPPCPADRQLGHLG